MRQTRCAKINTANVPSLSSNAKMANASHPDGDVTTKTIVVTIATRSNVINGCAKYVNRLIYNSISRFIPFKESNHLDKVYLK